MKDDQFLHSPCAPDQTDWPFNTPWIMAELKRHGLEVQHTGYLDRLQAQLQNMTQRVRIAQYLIINKKRK